MKRTKGHWIFLLSFGWLALLSCQSEIAVDEALIEDKGQLILSSHSLNPVYGGAPTFSHGSDAILLGRYLDATNEAYRFVDESTWYFGKLSQASGRFLFTTEFQPALPEGWLSTAPIRYTSDVIVGEASEELSPLDSVVYYFENQDVSWVRDTRFAPLERKPIQYDSTAWEDACRHKERMDYLVLPRGYVEVALKSCPNWEILGRDSKSRPVAWHGPNESDLLIRGLNLALTELRMTGHRYEVHHDSWESIRQRGVLRIATERSPFTYFLERGAETGLGFELIAWFSKLWRLRTEVYPVDNPAEGLSLLESGQADLLLTLESGEYLANRIDTSRSYYEADLALVSRVEGTQQAQRPWAIDTAIDAALVALLFPGAEASPSEPTPGRIRWDDAVEALGGGELDRFITAMPLGRWLETQIESLKIEGYGDLEDAEIGWVFGVRSTASGLKGAIDQFIDDQRGSLIWNVIRNKYLRHKAGHRFVKNKSAMVREAIPYEAHFRRYARRFGLDWRLTAAQAQVESGFNPEAVSWVGARGILQVMPATAQELGVDHLHRLENGLEAGMKYLAWLMERFEPTLDYRQRLRFALASYNIGLGHVRDARRLAKELGLNPDRWFGNVEQAMLKLREPKYFKQARFGYCRGGEAVAYVSKIQKLYDVYAQSYEP